MAEALPLKGKTAVVTGGGGAIGGAAAINLARDGAAVMLVGRTQATLEKGRDRLLQAVPEARVELHAADATRPEDMQAALQAAHDMQGFLDIIVSVVGRGGGFVPILMHDIESFRWVLEVNVLSAFLAVRYGAPLMKRGGAIVCTSSTVAKIPFPTMSAYTAAKCAVEGFVKVAADEMSGAGIRVNAVRPGLTPSGGTGGMFADQETMDLFAAETPLVPWRGGFGEADDIGRAIRWLAGPESAWVTGQSIAIDGGHELRKYPDMAYMISRLHGKEAVAALRRAEAPPPRKP